MPSMPKRTKTMVPDRKYYWVVTPVGEACKHSAADVAQEYGVPAHVLMRYWRGELDGEAALRSLPSALLLVLFYAMMMITHENFTVVQGVEKAIDFDIIENANFAFNGVGTFGNKNFQDVNSYADFYSWLNLGFSGIFLQESTPISESSALTASHLASEKANMYLWHNRKVGPVKLASMSASTHNCANPGLADMYGLSCSTTFSGIGELELEPTEFGVLQSEFVEDYSKTVWLGDLDAQGNFRPNDFSHLESAGWLGEDTYRVKVSFITYNPHFDLLTESSVHFLFPRTGHIWKKITHRTLTLNIYESWFTTLSQVLFFGLITTMTVTELKEVIVGLRKQNFHVVTFLREYVGFWNSVDWLSIMIAFVMLGRWIHQLFGQAELQELIEDYPSLIAGCSAAGCKEAAGEKLFTDLENLGYFVRNSRTVVGFYPVCIMLRLFKAFSAQPRLAVVTRTVSAAAGDLFHFAIVFLSVFFTFAVMGMAFFGREQPTFATVDRAFMALFRALMGDFDVEDMEKSGRLIALIFFSSFMMVALLLLLNMLVAIMMDVYATTKQQALRSDSVVKEMWSIMRRSWQNVRGQRLRLDFIVKTYVQKVGEDAFDSDTIVTIEELMALVPGLSHSQAMRSLEGSVKEWGIQMEVPLEMNDMLVAVHQLQHTVEENLGYSQPADQCGGESNGVAAAPEAAAIGTTAEQIASGSVSTEALVQALALRVKSGDGGCTGDAGLCQLFDSLNQLLAARKNTAAKPAVREDVLRCLFSCSGHLVSGQAIAAPCPARDAVLQHLLATANHMISESEPRCLDSANTVIPI